MHCNLAVRPENTLYLIGIHRKFTPSCAKFITRDEKKKRRELRVHTATRSTGLNDDRVISMHVYTHAAGL